jgi:hypothetical protein
MRNVDSRIHSLRFDCCIFLFYSLSAVTFATQSPESRHRATRLACPLCQKQTYAVQQTVSQVLAVIDRSAVGELPLNSYSSSKTRIHVYKHRFMYMG